MKRLFLLCIGFLVVSIVEGAAGKLLAVLLDGFRWDYIPSHGGFHQFIKDGVKAEYMSPVYPSESYPGYYAFMTGLYGDVNGIPLNYMYDQKQDIFFEMLPSNQSEKPFWWERTEPLWVTTTRRRIPTGSFHWPGGHVPIHGIKPHIYTPYTGHMYTASECGDDLKTAVDLLANDTITYAQAYCEFPDLYGHALGPFVVKNILVPLFLNSLVSDLLKNIKEKKLDDKLNVIIASDHGMTNSFPFSVKTIKLGDVGVTSADIKYILDRGSHVGIYPADGKSDKIYNQLKKLEGVKVYYKDELPEKFHLRNSDRVPPIFVEVLKGYYLAELSDNSKKMPTGNGWQHFGFHGYDADTFKDMQGIFIARGPDFKKGKTIPPIKIVDPYNLMLHLLGIDSKLLPNNGTWSDIKDVLV